MINTVRNTVLSVLNKNNYGYLSPSDFNLFAKQAQLDLFESYFYQYNYQINKENARTSGTGYADITKGIEEELNVFSVSAGLYNQLNNVYFTPSPTTTGSDYYLLNKVLIYDTVLDEGTTTATVGGQNKLIDSAADFTVDVQVGDIVAVENSGVQYVNVLSVDNANELTVSASVINAIGLPYAIYKKGTRLNEVEKVTHSKITMLNNSILTSPNTIYPAYTTEGALMDVFPESINSIGRVRCQYVRYPQEPKWTYLSLTNGEPVFDPSQPDYQDFELALDSENDLILKILQYAGVSIREAQIYQFAQGEETQTNQEQS